MNKYAKRIEEKVKEDVTLATNKVKAKPSFSFPEKFYGPFFYQAGRLLSYGRLHAIEQNNLLEPTEIKTEKLYKEFLQDWQKEKRYKYFSIMVRCFFHI